MMKKQNPAPTGVGNGAGNNAVGTANLALPSDNFNSPNLALRQRFLHLGAELHRRGARPVAEFISELADIPPEIADEIQVRLEIYCGIPAEAYLALGSDCGIDEVGQKSDPCACGAA